MQAALYEHYGSPDVIHVREMPRPEPADNEVLIQVYASTVNSADWRVRSLDVPRGFGVMVRAFFGVFRPRKQILGTELTGKVVAIGARVSRFAPGDEVIAYPGSSLGAHAEYIALPEDGRVVARPASIDTNVAAALGFGGITALHFLRDRARVTPGERVLVVGASGTVGSAAVQLARHFGAEVTALTSGANAALVRELGAHHTIDYREHDVAQGDERWDVIFDAVGSLPPAKADAILNPGGRLLMVVATLPDTLRSLYWGRDGKRAIAGSAPERVEDLRTVVELARQGAYSPPIDSTFPLADIVDAHRRVDSGRKRGSVVIHMPAYQASMT